MTKLILALLFLPLLSIAEEICADPPQQKLICDQLSDSQCFSKEVGSICLVNAQKGASGFCHAESTPYEQTMVTCHCY